MSLYRYSAIVLNEEYKQHKQSEIQDKRRKLTTTQRLHIRKQNIQSEINQTHIKTLASGRKITVSIHQCNMSKNTKLYHFGKPTGILTIFSNLEKSC